MFPTLVGAALVAWVAAFIARPRRPSSLDDTPWLVYSRYCGVRDRLLVFALVVTVGALLTGIVSMHQTAPTHRNDGAASCNETATGVPLTCYVFNPDHSWSVLQRELNTGGKWHIAATISPRQEPYR
jgi:hypothetical protein